MIKIFGREPVMWVSLLEAALVLLLAFRIPGLGQDDVVNIVAATTAALGVYVAYVTRDTMLGVVVGLVKSTIALAVGYGAPLTEDQTAAAIALTTVLVGFFQRTQTAPASVPGFRDPTPADELSVPVRPTRGEIGTVDLTVPTFILVVTVFLVQAFAIVPRC